MIRIERFRESVLGITAIVIAIAVIFRLLCLSGYSDPITSKYFLFCHENSSSICGLVKHLSQSCADFSEYGYALSFNGLYIFLCGVVLDVVAIFRALSRELWIICIIYVLYPLLEAYWVMLRPDWLQDMVKNSHSQYFASFDSNPPLLEPYEDNVVIEESINHIIHSKQESIYSRASNSEEGVVSGDWLVFDPTYGVIPHETAELWKDQTARADEIRATAQPRPLPPVRFSRRDPAVDDRAEN